MSGRLVISKHKSYHVWNQDNVEKVMRDERLHKEKLEAEAQREKESIEEKNREILLSSSLSIASGLCVSSLESRNIEPSQSQQQSDLFLSSNKELFNIFGDLESNGAEELARKTKKKEQEMKDALILRQNGAAPWALGDGSREKSKISAWYDDPLVRGNNIAVMGKIVSGKEADSAMSRDSTRKRKLDPMEKYMYNYGEDSCNNPVICVESKEKDEEDIITTSRDKDNIKKSIDGEKLTENNRKKSHKHKKEKKKVSISKQSNSSEANRSTSDDNTTHIMNELRRKRVEREKLERKKTAVLLSNVDIYGSSSFR